MIRGSFAEQNGAQASDGHSYDAAVSSGDDIDGFIIGTGIRITF